IEAQRITEINYNQAMELTQFISRIDDCTVKDYIEVDDIKFKAIDGDMKKLNEYGIYLSPFFCFFEPTLYNKDKMNTALYAYNYYYIEHNNKYLLVSPKEKYILETYTNSKIQTKNNNSDANGLELVVQMLLGKRF